VFCGGDANEFGPLEVLLPVIRVIETLEVHYSSYAHLALVMCSPLERIELFVWQISYFNLVLLHY
jgi:hypothetical protein